ncbi:MAG: DUF445 domain-containing protein [Cyclonatronaceae bacterium]
MRKKSDTFPSLERLFEQHIAGRMFGTQKTAADASKADGPPKDAPDAPGAGLRLLMLLPWVLGAGFGASFFWDFEGIMLHAGGYPLSLEGLIRVISISGLIGFSTNWIAIQMLFYPRRKRPLLRQGLIPAQKDKIARRLSAAVERELINPELIKQEFIDTGLLHGYINRLIEEARELFDDASFQHDVNAFTGGYIRRTLENPQVQQRLATQAEEIINENMSRSAVDRSALRLYLLFKGKTLREVLEEALRTLPENMQEINIPFQELGGRLPLRLRKDRARVEQLFISILGRVVDTIDIRKIAEDSLHRYDEEKLERVIRGATDTHLNYIKYLGGLIGMVGGLVIWNPLLSLLFLLVAGLLVWIVDVALAQHI